MHRITKVGINFNKHLSTLYKKKYLPILIKNQILDPTAIPEEYPLIGKKK